MARITAGVSARSRRLEIIGFALLAYVPFLLSSPGQVSADTKHYFYLDPGRMLSRAPSLWDPHIGTGSVPHQTVGFLFPMGPYYWVMDQLGVPDWVAQRLWLGTLSFVAALGMLWLLYMLGARRAGVIAGALAYMLTPYQLAFTARLSALLIPWAVLPWLVGLTARALKRGGWRDPALFAFVVLPAGSANATSLLLAGIAPALWLVFAVIGRQARAREALATAGRIGVLAIGVCAWWASGLVAQSRYGIPILDVTETVRTVSTASNPADLLRGLGNWFFLGSDSLGRWLDQSAAYAERNWLAIATFAVPGLALVGAAVLRWRHRAYFAGLVVVGVIFGVGAWPYDNPSPIGAAFKSVADSSAFGLALRNTPRVVPIVVLGVAGLLAAGVSVLAARQRLEWLAAGAVCLCVVVGFSPVWETGYLSDNADRPEDIPEYTFAASDALADGSEQTRVLELPGALFGAYRWGYTVDPITPGLTDRKWAGRELPPYGSPASVDLLAALDRRVQEGTFEASSLAGIARLLRSGTVFVRSDLEYERFGSPRPRLVWKQLTDPLAPGLKQPRKFGPGKKNRAAAELALFDELELVSSGEEDPPELALFDVTDVPGLVTTKSVERPVIVAGNGDGLVEAAAAGVLDGDELILYSASLTGKELRAALAQGADLVITDSNRRRARRWNSLRDETGITERAGQVALRDDTDDFRLEPVADPGDGERTVVEHRGGRVDATGYGVTGLYRPEDRPAQAFDDDLRTSWRAAGGLDARGERIILRPDEPVHTDHITLVQLLDAPIGRWITKVQLRFDEGDPVTVTLDDSSRTPEGQGIGFSDRTFKKLEVEILEVTPGTDAVGFAEIRADMKVDEVVRLPTALVSRLPDGSRDYRMIVVLARERYEPADVDHRDEELGLARVLTVDETRSFGLSGTARLNPRSSVDLIDEVLGTQGTDNLAESGHLGGVADARVAMAFDGDSSTAWTSLLGAPEQQFIAVRTDNETTIDHLDLEVVADGRHSVPTRLQLVVDNVASRTIDLPTITDRKAEQATEIVSVDFEPVTGRSFHIVIDAVRPVAKTGALYGVTNVAPVAIAEVGLDGAPIVQHATELAGECRDDLITLDDEPVAVRILGAVEDGRRGWDIEMCDLSLVLSAGEHVLRSAYGIDTGIDVDRLVLTSNRGGPVVGLRPPAEIGGVESPATVRVLDDGPTAKDVRLQTDGEPFWLILGESDNAGWTATTDDGIDFGVPRLVDGFANGWLVTPEKAGTMLVHLRWTGQNVVWIAMAVSVVTLLACGLLLWSLRRRAGDPSDLEDTPVLGSPVEFDGDTPSLRAAVIVGAVTAVAAGLVSRPWIGVIVGAAAFLACRVESARVLLLAGAPLALAGAKIGGEPELGWLAVLLFGADVVCAEVRRRVSGAVAPTPAGR
ncbi:MAG: DUF3367 domain-containing protein [Actinobacteria bacterium]|nr:DUF3367 domain-containing protein [Actinomycetota bacterium]